jgi:hypothetical protein
MDKRTYFRYSTERSAKLYLDGGKTVRGVVRNLSTTGACLEVEDVKTIPDIFFARIQGKDQRVQCHVVWRNGNLIGVACL